MTPRYLLAAVALVLLAPLLILQGLYLRRHAVRLPPAHGGRTGVAPGNAPALGVLVLGESTAAGVGVHRHGEALAGQVAKALQQELQREIHWEVAGLNGLTAARTAVTLFPWVEMRRAPIVVLALGVNDTLALRTPRRWLQDLGALIAAIRARFRPRLIVISPVPPVGQFSAIPQPLRAVFGLVARSLDAVTAEAYRGQRDVLYTRLPRELQRDSRYLGADGIHPSAAGYAVWGALLAEAIAQQGNQTDLHGA